MRLPIVLLAALTALSWLGADGAGAATQEEALQFLIGRWTNKGNCGDTIQFQRQGASWTYREVRFDRGKAYPARVSAGPSGVVTVRIPGADGGYEYVNTFRSKDTFDAVEGFTSGPLAGRRRSYTYTRCN